MKKNKKNILNIIGLSILFTLAGILIFKNILIYASDTLISGQIGEFLIGTYEENNGYYSPLDDTVAISSDNLNLTVNEIVVSFENNLKEDTLFVLTNTSSDTEPYTIEQKSVRKGYSSIKFSFEEVYLDSIQIKVLSPEGNSLVDIPRGKIDVNVRHVNFIQYNATWLLTYVSIIAFSVLLSIYITSYKKKHEIIYTVNSRNKRESNLELLRVICMILLVAHHYAVHGGLLNLEISTAKYVGLAFLPIGKICFLAFVAISMFFLVDGKHKSERFLRCWLEVVFYSVSLVVVTYAMGGIVKFKDFVSAFFVMISNSHGFAASYLLFLLVYPFILKATKDCSKKQARYLLVVLFWLQILSQIFRVWTQYTQPVFSELTLFVFCYVLSMNLKRYPIKLLDNKLFDLLVVIAVYMYVYVINVAIYTGNTNESITFLSGITADESSIFFIIGGYALFYLFKNMHIKHYAFINRIAAGTFGVLLIHDHNFFRQIFWRDLIQTQTQFHSDRFFLQFLAVVFGTFVACSVIDYVRREVLENSIVKSKLFNGISDKMERIINEDKK